MVLRFPFYSLRTGIVVCLTFLILSAMLLINVVMVKFAERDLIDAKVEMGRILIHTIRTPGDKYFNVFPLTVLTLVFRNAICCGKEA